MRCFISRPEAIGKSWFIGSCMEFLSVRIDSFDQKLLDDFFAEGGQDVIIIIFLLNTTNQTFF